MGLFGENAPSKNIAEVFPPGVPFRLLGAVQQGMVQAGVTGERRLAEITVSAVEDPETVLPFGVWGSLADQLTELEAGELPAIVTLTNDGGVWKFAPHGPPAVEVKNPATGEVESVPQRVAVEAHMVEDAPTGSPLTAVSEKAAPPAPEVSAGGHRPPVSVEPPSVKPTTLDDSQVFQPGS